MSLGMDAALEREGVTNGSWSEWGACSKAPRYGI